MRAIDLLKYFGEPMKALSEVGIKMDDHQYLNLWKEPFLLQGYKKDGRPSQASRQPNN